MGFAEMPADGIHSVTVPGTVAGWATLHSRFGRLPLADVIEPAIFYAERGFPVSDIIAQRWATYRQARGRSERRKNLSAGRRAPRAGELFRNRDLADALRADCQPRPFGLLRGRHRGRRFWPQAASGADDSPRPTCVSVRAGVGGSDLDDLPRVERARTAAEHAGIAALMMLDVMEQFPIRECGFHSARSLHVMIEAKKLAYADMLRHVGDPRFGELPVSAMLDKSCAKARAKLIVRADAAATHVEPSVFDGVTDRSGGDTIYLSAIDRDGNIVSLIQSIYRGFGSGIVPPGTGFALHNRGVLFSLDESHPNALAPRKRPLHTLIPAFMQPRRYRIGFGIMGGWNQAQAHAQFVSQHRRSTTWTSRRRWRPGDLRKQPSTDRTWRLKRASLNQLDGS